MIFGSNVNGPIAPAAVLGSWVRLVAHPGLEAQIAAYQGAGLDVLLVLARESYGDRCPDDALAALAGVIEQVDWLQVGNEPDIRSDSSWTLDPQEYADYYNHVRRLFPQHKVVTAGLASGDPDWLARTLPLLHIPPDAVAVHPYGQAPSPDFAVPWDFGRPGVGVLLDRYRAVWNGPLWVTEFGVTLDEVTEDFRTAYLVAMTKALAAQPRVERAAVFSLHPYAGWGLLNADHSPTPAYDALDGLIEEMTVPEFTIGEGFQNRINELGLTPKSDETYFTPDLSICLTDAGPLWFTKHTGEVLGPFPNPKG